jgi:cyclopropane fatty-acyl-phospholipid synthase-like methyltransferase
MTCSCVLYEDPSATLEDAPRAKRLIVVRKARLGPGDLRLVLLRSGEAR